MAPEQIEGSDAGALTDIFAFGAVLYEMATGRKAFPGKSRASIISAILRDEPGPVSQVQPMAPAVLDRLVRKCLAKDPEDRWQSARDVRSELEWIRDGASGAAAASAPERAAGSVRSFPGSSRPVSQSPSPRPSSQVAGPSCPPSTHRSDSKCSLSRERP